MWLTVKNPALKRFYFEDYGMKQERVVTETDRVQVPDEVGERLLDHPSGDFEKHDEDNQ